MRSYSSAKLSGCSSIAFQMLTKGSSESPSTYRFATVRAAAAKVTAADPAKGSNSLSTFFGAN
jgi:hypothetical protein